MNIPCGQHGNRLVSEIDEKKKTNQVKSTPRYTITMYEFDCLEPPKSVKLNNDYIFFPL